MFEEMGQVRKHLQLSEDLNSSNLGTAATVGVPTPTEAFPDPTAFSSYQRVLSIRVSRILMTVDVDKISILHAIVRIGF